MSNQIYQAAKKLLKEGCSVVPIRAGQKRPQIEWQTYQTRRSTEEEIRRWFVGTDNQLGLVTGNVSGGRFILDFDGLNWGESFCEFLNRFPEFLGSRIVQTGSGRPHVYGKCPDLPPDFTRKIKKYYDDENEVIGEVELRGNGHQCLVPPSRHPTGSTYSYADENAPVTEVTLQRFREIIGWIEENQRSGHIEPPLAENIEADELTSEQKIKLANYYLRRIMRQVRRHANRNDKGYELARYLNSLKLAPEEAEGIMQKYADEVPQWVEKDPYTLNEAIASLQSAYRNERESPWIPWRFLEEFQREREEAKVEVGASETEPVEEPPASLNVDFPREAVRGFIKTFADTFSKFFESPYEFWVFNAAVYLGSLVVRRVRLETSLRTESRLYVACIGESGVTRKSEANRQTYGFIEEFMKICGGEISVCHGVGSANGLARFLREHPCGILQIDELRAILQKTDIRGSVLLETLTSLFDGNRYSNYTKDEAIDIQDASLSLIGSTTIRVWEEMFSSPSVSTGLVNRFWIVPGQTDRVIPRPNIPRYQQLKVMARLLKALEAFPVDRIVTLGMEPDVEELWNEWYRQHRTNETDSDVTTRLDTYGDRLMMLLSVSEGKTSIDADLVERVISLLEWQKNVRMLYQPKDFDNRPARVENMIRRAGLVQKEWSRAELYSKVHAERFGLDVFNRALRNLEEAGVLSMNGRGKDGKIRFS